MLPLTHLGIGSAVVRPFFRSVPLRWLLLGTLLPDLIDKPVFFVLGGPGRRGFAHTLVFLGLLFAVARLRRSDRWMALALGTATHLVLDIFSKATGLPELEGVWKVMFWPALGFSFPVLSYGIPTGIQWALEIVGAALLILQAVRDRGGRG